MVDADHLREANPWVPITDPLDIAIIGKLQEELAELSGALARASIQGLGEAEPVTGKLNRTAVLDEIADVETNLELFKTRFEFSEAERAYINQRALRKMHFLMKWHGHIRRMFRVRV